MRRFLLMIGCILMLLVTGCGKADKDAKTSEDAIVEQEAENTVESETATEGQTVSTQDDQAKKDEAVAETTQEDSKAEELAAAVEAAGATLKERTITTKFTSELLAAAIDGSKAEKQLVVYLPPSYNTSEKKYPVIYFFHGFGDSPMFVANNARNFDKYMLQEGKEFILVGVDGQTKGSSGSFYVNSPITGPWEDYVLQEIIPYIDTNYRTIAKAEGRATVGFSMGGFAAFNLAFLHPDTFSGMLSMGPGLLRDDQLDIAMDSWAGDSGFLRAYSQSFAPNLEAETLGDIPAMDGSAEDAVICDKWLNGFGHLDAKVDAYIAKNQPLKTIYIVYGKYDSYKWIPEGSKYLSEILTQKGITNTLTEFSGGHVIPMDFMENFLMPFVTDTLTFEE